LGQIFQKGGLNTLFFDKNRAQNRAKRAKLTAKRSILHPKASCHMTAVVSLPDYFEFSDDFLYNN